MLMTLYINGTGIVSPAGSNTDEGFPQQATAEPTDQLLVKEPDYSSYIPPMQLRRMSKAVRMGIAASKICLAQAGLEKPSALSVGTAVGCLHDSEQFLAKMVAQDEQMLTPTAFIQSTHNTVAGQIALVTGCYGHNLTFVHKGHSFEHAVVNARLYLLDHPGEQVMTGGIEELTPTGKKLIQRAGIYNPEQVAPDDVLHGSMQGCMAGEGAAFFIMSDVKSDKAILLLRGLNTFVAGEANTALRQVQDFLHSEQIATNDPDIVMLGINGDEQSVAFYDHLQKDIFKGKPIATFKNLSGDYGTASALGLGIITTCIKRGSFPQYVIAGRQPASMKKILFINHFVDHYSCWYLEAL